MNTEFYQERKFTGYESYFQRLAILIELTVGAATAAAAVETYRHHAGRGRRSCPVSSAAWRFSACLHRRVLSPVLSRAACR